jgi:sugar lactone lactonase YvrE
MRGSLALRNGVLYVGTEERTAHVRSYDLDGTALEAAFSFRGEDGGAASVDGLDVDADHRVWVADGAGARLLGFSLVGAPLAALGAGAVGDHDARGVLGRPVDVCSLGEDDGQCLIVASGGVRRHAVQVLPLDPRFREESLRPLGDQDGRFHDVRGLALDSLGRELFVCEAGRARVQVFRDQDFHRALTPRLGRARFEPNALAVCGDGRLVIAQGGEDSGLLLCARNGELLRVLAEAGTAEGEVEEPGAVVVEEGSSDRSSRVVVIDRDGLRVQVFNLLGDCWGTFQDGALSQPGVSP